MTSGRSFDSLCPEIRVLINGNEMPPEARADLISVSVTENDNASAMANITLVCWDGERMKVKWIDDDLFKEGNELEIEMGYRGKLASLFQGEITALEPDFPNGAQPTMNVQGNDRHHRLMRGGNTRTYLGMKDSDIVSQIASKHGLSPEVEDSGTVFDYVMQHNKSDFQFLRERAERIGYEALVEGRKLLFRRRRYEGGPDLLLERDVALLSFRPRLSTMSQTERVSFQAPDARTKGIFTCSSGRGEEQAMADTSGPAVAQNAFGNTGTTTVSEPVQSQQEGEQLTESAIRESALRYIQGDGECIGNPDLRVGKRIELTGFGKRFSGLYYVVGTSHSYSTAGYKTTFQVKRNAT